MRFQIKKGTSSFYTVLCMVFGAVLLLFPSLIVRAVGTVFGILCILWGIKRLVLTYSHAAGLLSAVVGCMAFFWGAHVLRSPGSTLSLLPLVAGLFFIYDGISRIRSALAGTPENEDIFTRLGGSGVFGAGLTLAGLWLILFPINAVDWTLRMIGILILIDAAGDFFPTFFHDIRKLSSDGKSSSGGSDGGNYIHRAADGKYEAEFRDITDKK